MSPDSRHGFEPLTSDTAKVITQYEEIISSRIADKTLKAAGTGIPPTFSPEETLFLEKKAGRGICGEVGVEITSPTVTLKKGNTEINLGHAADVVKRMEKTRSDSWLNRPKRMADETDKEYSSRCKESGHENDAESPMKIIAAEYSNERGNTVNKNAYEIRRDVLEMALDWVKYKGTDAQREQIEDEHVLNVAKKFYNFVENKRR